MTAPGLDSPERAAARQRGELAAQMVTVACEMACLVRDNGPGEIAAALDSLTAEQMRALIIVQAAMIPDDRTPADLLSWVTWDEHGNKIRPVRENPLPGPSLTGNSWAEYRFPLRDQSWMRPCGTYAAYMRHLTRGETPDDDCKHGARLHWAAKARNRRARIREETERTASIAS